MKSALPFRGVQRPERARVLREFSHRTHYRAGQVWSATVREIWHGAQFREERYAAIDLTGHRLYRAYQRPETLPLYEDLIVTGAWWDYVDEIAARRVGPILRAAPVRVAPVMRAWARNNDLWRRRTAILCQLGAANRSIATCSRTVSSPISPTASSSSVRPSAGRCAAGGSGWVRAFVDQHAARLSPLSYREATKHL